GGEISGNCVQINADGNDIGQSSAGGISLISQSVLHMYGGRIANNSGDFGGGVYVGEDCGFVMEQGDITGNQGYRGGGVSVLNKGSFTMNGGRIAENNTVWERFSSGPDDSGAGVYVIGTALNSCGLFTMNGGEIRDNKNFGHGGGVAVDGLGEFVMNAGKISNNVSDAEHNGYKYGYGGGVYIVNSNRFTMNGGEITGNRAYLGGGVYTAPNGKDMIVMTVGGDAKVSGNQDTDGNTNNVLVWLLGHSTQKIAMNTSRPFTDGASIGVHIKENESSMIAGDVTGENGVDYSRFFRSDSEKFEVTNSDSGNIIQLVEAKSHNWASEWSSDAANHWHACLDTDCNGKKDVAGHTEDSGTRTKEPTETEKGTITYRCTVCGYEMRTEEIPETGEEQSGAALEIDKVPGAPDISFVISSKEELAKLIIPLLTEEEKAQVEAGADVKLILKVQDAQGSVNDADKAVVTEALNGFTVGQYLDITLKKAVGTAETPVTETGEKVKLVIRVPESLKNTDTDKTRTFAVIRVHNGTATVLNDLDESADTITIETNRFSTYALVYNDAASSGGSGDGGNGNSGNSGGSGNGSGNSGNSGGSGSGSGNSGTSGNSGNGGSGNGVNAGDAANSSVVSVYAEAGGGDSENSGGLSNNGSDSGNGVNTNNAVNSSGTNSTSGGKEPKTGDNSPVEVFATAAMILGLIYLLLYFADRTQGMTEREKDAFVAAFIRWAKKGGIFRKLCAFAAIFVLLTYYHSIGKRTAMEWGEVYGA
nr:hypothetical protein [Lachnospiraceae bacterium]